MDLQNFFYTSVSISLIVIALINLILFGMTFFVLLRSVKIVKKIDALIDKTQDNAIGLLFKIKKILTKKE